MKQAKQNRFIWSGYLLFMLFWVLGWSALLIHQNRGGPSYQRQSTITETAQKPLDFDLSKPVNTLTLSHPDYPSHHAAQFVMGSPTPHLIWFAGSREGADDVVLLHSRLINQQWSYPKILLTRQQLEKKLGIYIKKIGNAVGAYDPTGAFHLWVTHVSLGGWASSRIAHLRISHPKFSDTTKHIEFDQAQNLNLSGFLNISYLVRNPPIIDGNQFVLPIYHELYDKYPALLWQSFDGTITQLHNIPQAAGYFQGVLVTETSKHDTTWWQYLRPRSFTNTQQQRVIAISSQDHGQSWSSITDASSQTYFQNPNAGIAALVGSTQHLLVSNIGLESRSTLVFATGSNPSHLDGIHEIASAPSQADQPQAEFSYPALHQQGGSLWLAYTHNRQRIVVRKYDRNSSQK